MYLLVVQAIRVRRSAIRAQASRADWPVPVRPPIGAPAEVVLEWGRLYKRLRWALRNEVDLISNVRPGAKLARLRAAAKQRGLEVELTLEEYTKLIDIGRCHYCGARPPDTGHGIDRKDPLLGYTLRNVVVACDACNRIKADLFSCDQMLEIGNLLRRWRAEGRWKDPQRKDGRRFGGRPSKGDLRREIEEWNERWLSASGATTPDGTGLVREHGAPYAVEHGRPELLDERKDDLATLVARRWASHRPKADWADVGAVAGHA